MPRHAINPVIDYVRDWWDGGDPWGTAINALFDLAEVMYSAGMAIPEELEYRHGPFEPSTVEEMATEDPDGQTSYGVFVFASAYLSGEFTENDMRLAALTLNRYLALCRDAGLDY